MPCLAPNQASPFEWDWCTNLGGLISVVRLGGASPVPCETKWACERRAVSPCWVRVCGRRRGSIYPLDIKGRAFGGRHFTGRHVGPAVVFGCEAPIEGQGVTLWTRTPWGLHNVHAPPWVARAQILRHPPTHRPRFERQGRTNTIFALTGTPPEHARCPSLIECSQLDYQQCGGTDCGSLSRRSLPHRTGDGRRGTHSGGTGGDKEGRGTDYGTPDTGTCTGRVSPSCSSMMEHCYTQG